MMTKERLLDFCDRGMEIALYSLVFFIPISKAAIEIFAVFGIICFLIKKGSLYLKDKEFSFLPKGRLKNAFLLFLLINFVSVCFSQKMDLSLRAFFSKVFEYFLLCVMAHEVILKRGFKRLLYVFMAVSLLMVADSAAQYLLGKDFLRGYPPYKTLPYPNLRACFKNSNDFASWLIIVIPLLACCSLDKTKEFAWKGKERIIFLISAVLLTGCLVFTDSRAGYMALFIGLIFAFGWLFNQISRKTKGILLGCFVIALIGLSVLLPSKIKERLVSTFSYEKHENRLLLWKEALSVSQDYPWIGSGLNTYTYIIQTYPKLSGGGTYPHNSFLHMMAETGILGLVSFLWILIVLYFWGAQTLGKKIDFVLVGLLAGLLAFLILSFFDTSLYAIKLAAIFWIFIGLILARIKQIEVP